MRRCATCSEVKPLTEFHMRKGYRDGRLSTCRACVSVYNRAYYVANQDRIKAHVRSYQSRNADSKRERDRSYYDVNREARLSYARAHRNENREGMNVAARTAYRLARRARLAQSKARRARLSLLTEPLAVLHGKRWTAAEDAIVLESGLTDAERALMLGRTCRAVEARRYTILNRRRHPRE